MPKSYLTTLVPALIGIAAGSVIVGSLPEGGSLTYDFSEFSLWRVMVISQTAIYSVLIVYLAARIRASQKKKNRRIKTSSILAGLVFLVLVAVPHVLVELQDSRSDDEALTQSNTVLAYPPSYLQDSENIVSTEDVLAKRMFVVVIIGAAFAYLIVVLVSELYEDLMSVSKREILARICNDSRDLILLASIVVTLSVIGAGIYQSSLETLGSTKYVGTDVVSYGLYNSLLLALIFSPLLAAEQRAVQRIKDHLPAQQPVDQPGEKGTHSLAYVKSGLGILSPLVGALLTQIVPW